MTEPQLSKADRALALARERYQPRMATRWPYALAGTQQYRFEGPDRKALKAWVRDAWKKAYPGDDPLSARMLDDVIEDLRLLAQAAEPDPPSPQEQAAEVLGGIEDTDDSGGSGRAEINVYNRNPVDIADDIVAKVLAANDPLALFAMGGVAARAHDDGALEPYDADAWLLHVARLIDFCVPGKGEDPVKIVNPPVQPLRMTPKAILRRLPVLDRVTRTPYLNADGSLISGDGYDPKSRLILRSTVTLPSISDVPDQDEVARAVKLLTEEWLGDFPFAGETPEERETNRANLIAVLLTLTGRAFFELVPLFVVDASTAGSGKGLLVSTIYMIASGDSPHLMSLPIDGEEQRKTITSALLRGEDLLAWDEAHVIAGRTLAMILTAEMYSDRKLGTNQMLSVRNRFTQVAIGNNVQVFGDMKRRVVPCRLEPDEEHPEHRDDFRHPELLQWVRKHRGELLGAVLTIWRAWIAAGRPMAPITMGSFESWARVVGGALASAGIHGFLRGTADWLDFSDSDSDEWGEHLAQLRGKFGDEKFSAKDVVTLWQAGQIDLPHHKRDPDKSMAAVVGNLYRSVRNKKYGIYRLEPSKTLNSPSGTRTYVVKVVTADTQRDCGAPGNLCSAPAGSSKGGDVLLPEVPASQVRAFSPVPVPASQVRGHGREGGAGQVPEVPVPERQVPVDFKLLTCEAGTSGTSGSSNGKKSERSSSRATYIHESSRAVINAQPLLLPALPAAGCPVGEAVAYVEALILARHGKQVPDKDAARTIAEFAERHGEKAVLIAERAFDPGHYDGMWHGARILAGRFDVRGDDYFAKVILAELGGAR